MTENNESVLDIDPPPQSQEAEPVIAPPQSPEADPMEDAEGSELYLLQVGYFTGRTTPEAKVLDALRRAAYDEAKFLLENATAGEVSPAVVRAIEAGLELKNLGYTANNIKHIMDSKHLLDPLVKQFGSNEAAALRIHEAAQGLVAAGKNYVTGTWVALRIEQTVVHVKGAIVNGAFRVSTATMNPF